MPKPKIKGPGKDQLRRQILELKAQLAHAYHFADATLHRAEDLKASGVLLQLTAIGGQELIPPTVILNGLSPETIAALRKDIRRSWEYATELKPKVSA